MKRLEGGPTWVWPFPPRTVCSQLLEAWNRKWDVVS